MHTNSLQINTVYQKVVHGFTVSLCIDLTVGSDALRLGRGLGRRAGHGNKKKKKEVVSKRTEDFWEIAESKGMS